MAESKFGQKLLLSNGPFVIHSERGKGEDTLLIEDFLSRTDCASGLLLCSHQQKNLLIRNAQQQFGRKKTLGPAIFNTYYQDTVKQSLLIASSDLSGRDFSFFGRSFDWIGLYNSHDFSAEFIQTLDELFLNNPGFFRATSCPPFLPPGTWTKL